MSNPYSAGPGAPLRPLVVGSPRSGFSLLTSILAHFIPMAPSPVPLGGLVLKAVAAALGGHIADEIVKVFETAGRGGDLIYSPNFRQLTGGPKWLDQEDDTKACIRKYIGVRGLGDFTLVIRHPREILDCDNIVHSHVEPKMWATNSNYADYRKFASIRNPIGIINSSLFSINALTSEYIQRFVPAREDTHAMRENLALFKYTKMDFFEGIVRFYKGYFDEYVGVRDAYVEMRWEDLLRQPAKTISLLAQTLGLPVDKEHAEQIWNQIGHVNLTGAHKHNLRKGGGKPGDWKNWITNRHLEVIRDHDFEPIMEKLGYGAIPVLDEDDYTPFQRRVSDLMSKGEVYQNFPDQDLFGFAFNKSNIDSIKFDFEKFDWKSTTQVERSCFKDQALMMEAWETANHAALHLNNLFNAVLAEDFSIGKDGAIAALARIKEVSKPFSLCMPEAYDALFPKLERLILDHYDAKSRGLVGSDGAPPRLIRSVGTTNVVAYDGMFYGIPQSAGPVDLMSQSVEGLTGVITAKSYAAVIERVNVGRGGVIVE